MRGTRRRRTARALLALVVCASLSAAGPVAATATTPAAGPGVDAQQATAGAVTGATAGAGTVAQPETADEFLAALRALDGSPAFEAYGEFEVIRVQTVADVQVGEFSAADGERMALVLSVLQAFNASYTLAENGSRAASLERANETGRLVEELRAAGSGEYAVLASLALDRFYRDLGERFNAEAEATVRTPEKVALLEQAALAYRQAEAIERYTSLTVEADERRAIYEDDMATVNATLAATGEFLDGCDEACASPVGAIASFGPGVFEQYRQSRVLGARIDEAGELAEKHALSDTSARIDGEFAEPLAAARTGLTLGSVVLALFYALVVGAIAGLVTTRLVRWEQDVTASRVGEIVSAGGLR